MTVSKDIIEAVLTVRKNATSIKKDAKNQHGGYNYVSIDTYYEKIASVATQAGLIWSTKETNFELIPNQGRSKDRTYVRSTFSYSLMVKDQVAENYMSVTIVSPIDGPQTTGQLFSYADKVFMRVAFCVPTGEVDADDMKQEPITTTAQTTDSFLSPAQTTIMVAGQNSNDDGLSLDDGPSPKGDETPHDPATGEIIPEGLHKDHMEVVSRVVDDLPMLDTRKVSQEAVSVIEAIFTTFMPKIKSPSKLQDWHAENLAAIEKVKTHDPAAHDRIKAEFTKYYKALKAKEKK